MGKRGCHPSFHTQAVRVQLKGEKCPGPECGELIFPPRDNCPECGQKAVQDGVAFNASLRENGFLGLGEYEISVAGGKEADKMGSKSDREVNGWQLVGGPLGGPREVGRSRFRPYTMDLVRRR